MISLRRRFLNSTTVIAIAVMLFSVIIIDVTYQNEFKKSRYEKLRLHVFSLLSVVEKQGSRLYIPDIQSNPSLNTLKSGLWAAIYDENQQQVWHSLSIEHAPLQMTHHSEIGQWESSELTYQNQEFLTLSYHIGWEADQSILPFKVLVAEDKDFYLNILHRFRLWLIGGFAIITLVYLLCQREILKLAFRPITQLEHEIALLEEGEKKCLSENYPIELSGVTKNLNNLIEKEQLQREKYRSGMADLAHSLKTPIAIIRNEIKRTTENKILESALERIDSCIEYQLRRAVISSTRFCLEVLTLNRFWIWLLKL